MKQCIENPNEVKWDEFWENELKQKEYTEDLHTVISTSLSKLKLL